MNDSRLPRPPIAALRYSGATSPITPSASVPFPSPLLGRLFEPIAPSRYSTARRRHSPPASSYVNRAPRYEHRYPYPARSCTAPRPHRYRHVAPPKRSAVLPLTRHCMEPPKRPKKGEAPYNLHMKKTIKKIKEKNPGIAHREAFCKAAELWKTSPDNPKNKAGGSSSSGAGGASSSK